LATKNTTDSEILFFFFFLGVKRKYTLKNKRLQKFRIRNIQNISQ
jgi:hypothetical protein